MNHVRTAVSAIVLLALSKTTLAQVTTGALESVPDDAQVVVVVPSIEKFASGIGALCKMLGVREMEEFNGAAMVAETMEVGDGLDLAGSLVVALRTEDSSNPLMIIAAKDVAAWKKAASAEAAADGLSKAIVQGDDWFIGEKSGMLLLCQDADYLKKAMKGSAKSADLVKKRAGSALEKYSIVFVVDVPGCKDAIQQGMTALETMLRMGMAMQAGSKAEAGIAFWQWMFQEVRGLLADTESAIAGVGIGADGVRVGALCEIQASSKSADWLKSIKHGDGALLRGLPDASFGAAMACEWEGGTGESSMSARMLKAMIEAAPVEGADKEKVEAAIKKSLEVYKLMSGYSVVWSPIPDGDGMVLSGAYLTAKPAEVAKAVGAMMQDTTALASTFGMGMKFETTQRSEKIGASDVDVFGFKFDMKDEQAAQVLKLMYGDDASMFLAPRERAVAFAMGPSASARACMKRTLEPGATLDKSKSIVDAGKSISPDPHAVVFLDLPHSAQWVLRLASATGAPIPPIKFPAKTTALLAAGLYLDTRPRIELFVPAEALRVVVDAARGAEGGEPQ